MELLYLTLIILGCAGQNIVKKPFVDRFDGTYQIKVFSANGITVQ